MAFQLERRRKIGFTVRVVCLWAIMLTAFLKLVAFEWSGFCKESSGLQTRVCNSRLSVSTLQQIKTASLQINSPLHCEMIALLYEKGIFADLHDEEERNREYRMIFEPNQRPPDKRKKYEDIYQRLLWSTASSNLVYESDTLPPDVISWEESMRRLPPEWSDPKKSFVFHRDDPDLLEVNKGYLFLQRVQNKSLCHIHALAVLQHYLISKYSRERIQPTILDLPRFVREALSASDFERYVLWGQGTSTWQVLHMILEPGSSLKRETYRDIDAAMLSKHGPAVLNNFAVCDDFGAEEGRLVYDLTQCNLSRPAAGPRYVGCKHVDLGFQLAYSGDEHERCAHYHSMLIVGVRMQGSSRRFLVQNWWRRLQLLEVSVEYLETLPGLFGGNIDAVFVQTPQRSLRTRWHRPAARYAETAYIDTLEPELIYHR